MSASARIRLTPSQPNTALMSARAASSDGSPMGPSPRQGAPSATETYRRARSFSPYSAMTQAAVKASGAESAKSSSEKASSQRRTVARRPTMTSPRAESHHELGRSAHVPRGKRVLHGLLGRPLPLVPARGPAVERWHGSSVPADELGAQDLPEEVVVAVPLPPAIEGLDEEVRVLELGDLLRRILATEHGVAQRRREAVQDRRLQQEGEPLGRQAREQLAGEVVHQVAIVARARPRAGPSPASRSASAAR